MGSTKKKITRAASILFPLFMILFVAGSIYLPRLSTQPQHDFLYTSRDNSFSNIGQADYVVSGGTLVRRESQNNQILTDRRLYIHNVAENESREISFEEAQMLTLDSRSRSPDGFDIVYGTQHERFLLFPRTRTDYSTHYIRGYNVNKRLNLKSYSDRYSSDFRFLGWVE